MGVLLYLTESCRQGEMPSTHEQIRASSPNGDPLCLRECPKRDTATTPATRGHAPLRQPCCRRQQHLHPLHSPTLLSKACACPVLSCPVLCFLSFMPGQASSLCCKHVVGSRRSGHTARTRATVGDMNLGDGEEGDDQGQDDPAAREGNGQRPVLREGGLGQERQNTMISVAGVLRVVGLLLLADAAYSRHELNQLSFIVAENSGGGPGVAPTADSVLEVVCGCVLVLAATLAGVFTSPDVCSGSTRVALRGGQWVVDSQSGSTHGRQLQHPLRRIDVAAANSSIERDGKGSYAYLDHRPGFANLAKRALQFAAWTASNSDTACA